MSIALSRKRALPYQALDNLLDEFEKDPDQGTRLLLQQAGTSRQ